ncbi:MAG: NAD-dependent epimerase/dehydratase family protein [Treponema sp.]|nr:NAD-dependent epimerase/dehydratase family protein [Treponema sp.]MCL2272312.1 NAD-dependent epimerase/dehydratase family protein [Treponema sp.]
MTVTQLETDISHTFSALSSGERGRLRDAVILITGACGFLGYYLMHFLRQTASDLGIKKVIALDNFMLGKPAWLEKFTGNPFFVIEQFDIISGNIGEVQFADNANYIIHMASIASPVFYRKYPIETLDANIWGLRKLLDFYREKSIKGFLFFSSSEIYGDPDSKNIPTPEEYFGYVSITGPRACYDESKRFGETMCMLFAQQYNMPVSVARPFNNYGPGMKLNDKRVPADFALAVFEGHDIDILSNGSPTRTFCHIADSAGGYLKILLHGKYDYFNIGIEKPEITVNDLAQIYVKAGKEIFNYKGQVKYTVSSDNHYLTNNPQRRCPDITKAKSVLGYNPVIYAEEGIQRFLKYLKENDKNEFFW